MYSETAAAQRIGRRRRSVLFVPGSKAGAIQKSRGSDADCVVLDLEDMVLPTDKAMAREEVAATLRARDWSGPELIVRVNDLGTPWGAEDIAHIAAAGAPAVLLPKIESVADLERSIAVIDREGGSAAKIWVLAETPRAILNIDAIAGSTARLQVIVMGTQDLMKAMGIRPDAARTGLLYMLSQCMLAARANGVAIIDGVYLALKDEAGFAAACAQGGALGFDGKALIHPAQIAGANAAFGGPVSSLL